jgi:hypothetical protein
LKPWRASQHVIAAERLDANAGIEPGDEARRHVERRQAFYGRGSLRIEGERHHHLT